MLRSHSAGVVSEWRALRHALCVRNIVSHMVVSSSFRSKANWTRPLSDILITSQHLVLRKGRHCAAGLLSQQGLVGSID